MKISKKEKKNKNVENVGTGLKNISEDIKILQDRLLELERENRQLRSSLFTAKSDYNHLQTISEREKKQESNATLKRIANLFLPVVDDLSQAREMLANSGIDKTHLTPIKFIFDSVEKAIQNMGFEVVEPVGEEFNPHTCQLGGKIETDEYEEDVVCKVVRKGYKIADETIRPAIVICAKKENNSKEDESKNEDSKGGKNE